MISGPLGRQVHCLSFAGLGPKVIDTTQGNTAAAKPPPAVKDADSVLGVVDMMYVS